MKTELGKKMHKTFLFCTAEMSREAKRHAEWRVPTDCLTDKQTH